MPPIPWRRERRSPPPQRIVQALGAFRRTVEEVERAKEALVAAAPTGRSPGVPLAEALAGFEAGLAAAGRAMGGWRIPEVEEQWRACHAVLRETASRAARFRLEHSSSGYEDLYGELGDLLEPLEAFSRAARRFRSLDSHR